MRVRVAEAELGAWATACWGTLKQKSHPFTPLVGTGGHVTLGTVLGLEPEQSILRSVPSFPGPLAKAL